MKPGLTAAGLLGMTAALAAQPTLPERARFIDDLVHQDGFDRGRLTATLDQAHTLPTVLEAMAKPAETRPWYDYAPIFLGSGRVEDGVQFWRNNTALLKNVAQRFAVAPEVIVAIIGVETRYGKHTGRYRVLDALTTLAFHYPPRADFFRRQLREFLLLGRNGPVDVLTVKGSYAGAMGLGQFTPGSYRQFAVDFNQDGMRDLLGNRADAVASVANYLARHGWRRDGLIAVHANVSDESSVKATPDLKHSVADFAHRGVHSDVPLPGNTPAMLVRLDTHHGPEWWLGLNNFYVITRYNHSPLYAMAVFRLAQAIRDLHAQRP